MPDTDMALPASLDDLRGRTPDELRKLFEVVDAHLKSLHQGDDGELRDLSPEEQEAFDFGMTMRTEILDRIERHNKIGDIFRRRPQAVQQVYANIRNGIDLDDPSAAIRRFSNAEARDAALRHLDSDREGTRHLSTAAKDQLDRLIRTDHVIARRTLVTETPEYRSAWMKLVTQTQPQLTPEENRAVQTWYEFRAAAEWVNTSGGFGIPVYIDPSIMLTAQESGNPFLQIARQVNVNTNIWKGVSSAGVTWAFQTEAAASTDASPTLAQPTVTVHTARGFIPFSYEISDDYPAFASEMAALLAAGYDELLVDKFTRGSGTGEPDGVLTHVSAVSGDRVTLTTAPTLGAPDPYKVWKALPQKWRRRASWLMSVDVNNAIRQLGTANVYHASTINLPEAWADSLFNRAVYESPYMPDTTATTAATTPYAIVGDFSNYVIARNGGMSVELIPNLFIQVTANSGPAVPTGQRGWFAHARIGGDVVVDAAFRALVPA